MAVMLPTMLAARKLDSEDKELVWKVRVAYGFVQALTLLLMFLCYRKVSTVEGDKTVVYSAKSKGFMEMADKTRKFVKYTKGELYAKKFEEFRNQFFMGVCFTCGLHYYRGMVMGLVMQTVMGPFNLYDNVLLKWAVLSPGSQTDIGEKLAGELTKEDVIVEVAEDGTETQVGTGTGTGSRSAKAKSAIKGAGEEKENDTVIMTDAKFDELLLDTWDEASEANLKPLVAGLTKKTAAYQTSEAGWTALMIFCGLSSTVGHEDGVRKCIDLGASVKAVDKDGWTPLHWCAFHNNATAAKILVEVGGLVEADLKIKDKEGKTVRTICEEEDNGEVYAAIEAAFGKK